MSISRRTLVKRMAAVFALVGAGLGQLLLPIKAFAQRSPAFSADNEADAIAGFFPGESVETSSDILIDVHDVIENGAFVPVSIKTELPDIRSITILVEKNPNPLIANFKLYPSCKGFIATRIKMGESSDIIAIVRSGEQLYSTRKFVEVIAGGCG